MASHWSTDMAIQQNRYNATDFFIVGTGATTFALGFFGLNEGPERLWIAGAFALLALAFFASSFICWLQFRRFRRLAYERRIENMRAFTVVRGGGRSGR